MIHFVLILLQQCPGSFWGYIVGQDPSDLNPTGYKLTSSDFALSIWDIFFRFLQNDVILELNQFLCNSDQQTSQRRRKHTYSDSPQCYLSNRGASKHMARQINNHPRLQTKSCRKVQHTTLVANTTSSKPWARRLPAPVWVQIEINKQEVEQ